LKVYFDVLVLLAASLSRLSFLPLRSFGSSFVVFILDGLAPLTFPLSFSSSKVYGFRDKTKGSYSNDGMTFSKEFCVYIAFHFFHTHALPSHGVKPT